MQFGWILVCIFFLDVLKVQWKFVIFKSFIIPGWRLVLGNFGQWNEDQNNHLENKLIVNKQGIIMIMENQSIHQKFANICILKPLKYCSLSLWNIAFNFIFPIFAHPSHKKETLNIDIKNNDNHDESFYSMQICVVSSFRSSFFW